MKEIIEQEILLRELIDVYMNIDGRIKMLNDCSSTVFLKLNVHLKEFHKKYGVILKNITQIYDKTPGNKDSQTDEFKQIYEELLMLKDSNKKGYNSHSESWHMLNNEVGYVPVSIRNIKQALTTFSFLITNYKLISNNEQYCQKTSGIIDECEHSLSMIKKRLSEMDKSFEPLKQRIGDIHNSSRSDSDTAVNLISGFYDELIKYNVVFTREDNHSESSSILVKQMIQNSKDSIGTIITHLQYHDIIRQKIEHIQTTHKSIIESLKNDLESNRSEDGTQGKCLDFKLISDISGLQAAQLIRISKEYQKALELITHNFQSIANELISMSEISNGFSPENCNSGHAMIRNIIEKIDKSYSVLNVSCSEDFINNQENVENELNPVIRLWDEIYKMISRLEGLISKLGLSVNSNNSGTPSNISTQMTSLVREIVSKGVEINRHIHQIKLFCSDINRIEYHHNSPDTHDEEEMGRLMIKMKGILEKLDSEYLEFDKLMQHNNTLSQDIITKLGDAINYVDYYEVFDNQVNEIIRSLNTIINRLTDGKLSSKEDERRHNLREFDSIYTVKSERVIYDNVITRSTQIDVTEPSEEEDDIELF